MATVTFSCREPLGLEAAAALPAGARVDNGPEGARVLLALDLADLPGLLQRVAALARALPDATLSVEGLEPGTALALPSSETVAGPASTPSRPAPPPSAPLPPGAGPWELVSARRYAEARAAFAGTALDSQGRDRVRELLHSTDPEEVALACDIAGSTQWRSFVTSMKRFLDHADTRVRVAAVRAIGQLSGPAMIWQLRKLEQDPSPEVRQAVQAAIDGIEGRSG